jgi:hypothetical protein
MAGTIAVIMVLRTSLMCHLNSNEMPAYPSEMRVFGDGILYHQMRMGGLEGDVLSLKYIVEGSTFRLTLKNLASYI